VWYSDLRKLIDNDETVEGSKDGMETEESQGETARGILTDE